MIEITEIVTKVNSFQRCLSNDGDGKIYFRNEPGAKTDGEVGVWWMWIWDMK